MLERRRRIESVTLQADQQNLTSVINREKTDWKKKKNEQNSGAGRTVTKKANLHYQSPRRRGVKRVFQKIMAENFPTFIDTNLQTQEAE